MVKSLLDDNLPIYPPEYVVAAVFMRLEVSDLSQQALKKIIGQPGWKLPEALIGQWAWHSPYKLYENPGEAVRDFVKDSLPDFLKPLRLLREKHSADIELHLMIGAGDFKDIGYIPNVEFNSTDLSSLADEELGITIIMDSQMSKYTKGFK